MGWLVLIVGFAAEVALAAYLIATKSRHDRFRSWIRIGAITLFVALSLLAVIRWSFRWYGIALFLLVLAIMAAVRLLGKHVPRRAFSPARTGFRGAGMFLLLLIATIPLLIFPQVKPLRTTGSHPVATASYTYTDANRTDPFSPTGAKRSVNVEFWFPKDAQGTFPLVVFSHGAFGIKTSNSSTFMELASNGYVVCSIDHPHHALFTIGSDRHLVTYDPGFYREVVGVNDGAYDEAEVFRLENKWMKLRTDDINFVLDTILAAARSAQSSSVYALVDAGKIGLMGHSLGGASSALVARQRNDIGAVVVLDADLQGEYLKYEDGKYTLNRSVYSTPLLAIVADDVVRLIAAVPDANEVVALQHVVLTAPHAYEVHIPGTNHMSVTDLPLASPLLASMMTRSVSKAGGPAPADKRAVMEEVNGLALSFFDEFLKGKGQFTPPGSL